MYAKSLIWAHVHIFIVPCCCLPGSQLASFADGKFHPVVPQPLAQHVQSGPTYPIPGASPLNVFNLFTSFTHLPVIPDQTLKVINFGLMLLSHPLDYSHLLRSLHICPLLSRLPSYHLGWHDALDEVFRVKHRFRSALNVIST